MSPEYTEYRNDLLDYLNRHFGQDEFNILCFKLGVDNENLSGETKQAQLLTLLKRLNEKGVDELIGYARGLRPDLGVAVPPWERAECIAKARHMERKHAYREAAQEWQSLLDVDPEDTEASDEIERLEEKAEQTERLQSFKKDIFKRKNDIAPVFMAVATRLKQLEKEDIGIKAEVLLDLIGDFLAGNTQAEEFIQLWQEGVDAPPKHSIDAPNYEALAGRLQRGEIVLFLGSATSTGRLVPELAGYAEYPEFHGSLPEICEYLDINHQYGRGSLCEKLEELTRDNPIPPTHLHTCLAQVSVPVMMITTALDGLLEETFRQAGKPFVQVSHLRDNEQTGSLLLKYSDQDEVQPCPLDELTNLGLLDKGYSVVYKLRGCLKLTRALHLQPGTYDGLLLSEWDYFRFARYVDKLIPSYILRQLSGRGLWLLGHYPRSWEDRLLIEAILQNRLKEEQALTVQAQPDDFAKIYWEHHHVKNYPLELREFIRQLEVYIA